MFEINVENVYMFEKKIKNQTHIPLNIAYSAAIL